MFRFIGTRLPVFCTLTICAAHLIVAGPARAALESGLYLTTPGATVRERGDRVPNVPSEILTWYVRDDMADIADLSAPIEKHRRLKLEIGRTLTRMSL